MEVTPINKDAPKSDRVEAFLRQVNEDTPDINQINEIRNSAKSFLCEIEDINYIHVPSIGRKLREYEDLLWTKVEEEERIKFKCLYCSKVLCHFWSFRNHMLLHLQIFPFKCFACDKKYTNNRSLSLHIKTKHYKLTMSYKNASAGRNGWFD